MSSKPVTANSYTNRIKSDGRRRSANNRLVGLAAYLHDDPDNGQMVLTRSPKIIPACLGMAPEDYERRIRYYRDRAERNLPLFDGVAEMHAQFPETDETT
jgi:hypothetical protein